MKENSIFGKIIAVSTSEKKGDKKINVPRAELREDFGIIGDAHSGPWHRQISLLAMESIEKMQKKGSDVLPGDFAENITTQGVDLIGLSVGSKLRIGDNVVLEITQKGKQCHQRCHVYYSIGECVMPKEGVFARVIKGGVVSPKDPIYLLDMKEGAVV